MVRYVLEWLLPFLIALTLAALLAQAVMELYRERTVRIYRGTQQYITEEQEWK